jgi:hypothetical protein
MGPQVDYIKELGSNGNGRAHLLLLLFTGQAHRLHLIPTLQAGLNHERSA